MASALPKDNAGVRVSVGFDGYGAFTVTGGAVASIVKVSIPETRNSGWVGSIGCPVTGSIA